MGKADGKQDERKKDNTNRQPQQTEDPTEKYARACFHSWKKVHCTVEPVDLYQICND